MPVVESVTFIVILLSLSEVTLLAWWNVAHLPVNSYCQVWGCGSHSCVQLPSEYLVQSV